MKKAGGHIDLKYDKVTLFNETIPLKISKSGHYCIPLFQYFNQPIKTMRNHVQNVIFSTPIFSEENDKCLKQIRKLHKQFAHPIPEKL